MRHGKKINHLGRKASHRHLMLSNMASSLILHKRITTTVAKAKALKKYVEPLVTKAKNNTTHSRRVVFSYLQNKKSVDMLFGEVASRVESRPGGYTRVIRMNETRLGDGAETCLMELVDFNEIYKKEESVKKTRRSRTKATNPKKEMTAKEETQPSSVQPTLEVEDTTLPVNPEKTDPDNDAEEEKKTE